MEVLKMVEEALVAVDIYAPYGTLAEKATAALTALRGLGWRPIAEMAEFEPAGVRIGYLGVGDMWVMAPYMEYRRGAVASTYTHFCRPILPTPPKREVENA
jgi:hypothetical protein